MYAHRVPPPLRALTAGVSQKRIIIYVYPGEAPPPRVVSAPTTSSASPESPSPPTMAPSTDLASSPTPAGAALHRPGAVLAARCRITEDIIETFAASILYDLLP